MPGPIDDALKHLTELSPQDWVVRGGWPVATAALIDADIGTISGAADKAIRVASTPDWLLAIDFQAGHDSLAKLPDLLLYNSALPASTSVVSQVSRSMRPCDTGFCASGRYPRRRGFRVESDSCRWPRWAVCRKAICPRSWPR